MPPPKTFESVLSWSGRLIVAGLGLELVSCFWLDALAFVLFLSLGGLLIGSGTLLFLVWLASPHAE